MNIMNITVVVYGESKQIALESDINNDCNDVLDAVDLNIGAHTPSYAFTINGAEADETDFVKEGDVVGIFELSLEDGAFNTIVEELEDMEKSISAAWDNLDPSGQKEIAAYFRDIAEKMANGTFGEESDFFANTAEDTAELNPVT